MNRFCNPQQFAVYERIDENCKQIVLAPYSSQIAAEIDKEKYGYKSEEYFVDILERV